jgi:hypothetical protein
MTHDQAVRVAVEALRTVRKQCAFDANLHKQGVITAHTERQARLYERYSKAIDILLGWEREERAP